MYATLLFPYFTINSLRQPSNLNNKQCQNTKIGSVSKVKLAQVFAKPLCGIRKWKMPQIADESVYEHLSIQLTLVDVGFK